MIGVATEHALACACEQRLGRQVHVASTFDLRRFSCPAGHLGARKPERIVITAAPLLTGSTILVLGSDARPPNSKEPGAGGPARSDSIMLMHVAFGSVRKVSILRDSQAPQPDADHGLAHGVGGHFSPSTAERAGQRRRRDLHRRLAADVLVVMQDLLGRGRGRAERRVDG